MRLPLCLGLTLRISLCYSPSALSRNTYCTFLVKSPYLRVSLDSAYLVMWSFSLYTCALHDCRTRAPLRTSRACVNRRSIKENCTLNYISKATGRTEPILLQRVLISPSKKKKLSFVRQWHMLMFRVIGAGGIALVTHVLNWCCICHWTSFTVRARQTVSKVLECQKKWGQNMSV